MSVQGHGQWWFLQKSNSQHIQKYTWEQSRRAAGHTHTHTNTLWIQLPPGSLGVCLVVNNAVSEAGWQILRGSRETWITSEEMWRKSGLEHCMPWGRQKKKHPCAIPGERKGEQEQGCQHKAAESCLSKAAKRAEKTRRTSVTPWGALHIKALRAPVDESWRRQRKTNSQISQEDYLYTSFFWGHDMFKFMWRYRRQGVSIN